MRNKLIKVLSGLSLIALSYYSLSQIHISAASNNELELIDDYYKITPELDFLGEASIVDEVVNSAKWMTKNGLFPWWDDTYDYYPEDIYVTYKYSYKVDTISVFYCSDPIYGAYTNPTFIGADSNYIFEFKPRQDYVIDIDKEATRNFAFILMHEKGIYEKNNNLYGFYPEHIKRSNGLKEHLDYQSSTEHITLRGHNDLESYYRMELRAVFDVYTTYHFKAHYSMVEVGRRWNSRYYDIKRDGYEYICSSTYLSKREGTDYIILNRYKDAMGFYAYDEKNYDALTILDF